MFEEYQGSQPAQECGQEYAGELGHTGEFIMTTGKALLPFQESTVDIRPERDGTDARSGVEASADALQFAGLLLGAAASPGVRTILFASASENTPARQMIYETALALRLIRSSRVAVVLLSESQPASLAPDSMYLLESSLSRDWTAAGDASLAMFYWHHREGGRTPVPASAFAELAVTIQERFDFILVDAGPVGSSPQPILLAPHCTATVLLVKPGITTVAEVQSSQTLLLQAKARLLGFAFVETA
jgi:hypothetical protein